MWLRGPGFTGRRGAQGAALQRPAEDTEHKGEPSVEKPQIRHDAGDTRHDASGETKSKTYDEGYIAPHPGSANQDEPDDDTAGTYMMSCAPCGVRRRGPGVRRQGSTPVARPHNVRERQLGARRQGSMPVARPLAVRVCTDHVRGALVPLQPQVLVHLMRYQHSSTRVGIGYAYPIP